jgi:SAM-dependent methyltransferase
VSQDATTSIQAAPRPHCTVCGSSGSLLYPGLQDSLFGATGQWNMVECSNPGCRLLWLDPAPVASELWKAYRTYYTHQHMEPRSVPRRILSEALRLAVDACVGLSGLRRERQNVRNLHLQARSPGSLLEIGCGDGSFLQRMRVLGWKVQGIDFDADAIALARQRVGACVQAGQLTDFRYPDNEFDAIAMHHVLEHVDDPLSLMAESRRILRPGGLFVCITPNADSWGHRRFGRAWRGLEPPRHLNIFSTSALEQAARGAGFERFSLYSTTVNTWLFFEASARIARGVQESVPLGWKVLMLLRAIAAQLYASLANRKRRTLGEESVLVAEK